MADPAAFLYSLAQALSVMALYPSGHPSRERAVDAAYRHAEAIASSEGRTFTFLEDDVIYGRDRLRDMQGWDYAPKLVAAGVQRLEFERVVSRDEFDEFLIELFARLNPSPSDTSERRQMRSLGIRFGSVAMQGQGTAAPPPETTLDVTLGDEADTFRWLQSEIRDQGVVPLMEAEAVVRSLSVAMHSERRIVLPLLQLKEFDQYTTTHALNVSVLSMALAQALAVSKRQVRAIGVAGLLHDIGKIRIPLEVLTKPGKLTDEERRIMNQHPVDAAKIIMESEEELELAAVVAYEHHIMLNGGGYPTVHYARECTLASRMVHVCDVFDALSTVRPYRDAWPQDKVLSYLDERAGTEFDPALVTAFNQLMRAGAAQVRVLTEER